ncbi:4-hydroxy-3-methylbut-2-enyl diphosphate reductase [Plebeiibacterium sediminum]|uniref:4-hydroxy-3-methylbut-2-enyl diphosphate reductase n=1 Tax=Plebeiibacterium sediminum TaxID=2992112 RepID=A0AAE3M6P8_9BACT|nr:4-hydroxy-3-methylbut-2-enyl diphosphate reductase [Plebeiobacterium sediminum]MCW3788047.1 4-hydroxy-3-methylbut-2-enyl diphosphate reductase [Plebeiobacterium sediminum]
MSSLNLEIDPSSGFCFGVVKAIETAENELDNNGILYCLGDIVHNNMEMDRLRSKGMISINKDELSEIKSNKIFIRAHGEPPETYQQAKSRGLTIIDATCPVVLKLQNRIKKSWELLKQKNGQVIIYGKKGHAEVIGLMGQTNNEAFIIESLDEVSKIDLSKPTHLYAQTTKSIDVFKEINEYLSKNMKAGVEYKSFDTICRQVANRLPKMTTFAQKHELIIFVGGEKSSNAQMLFNQCKKSNKQSYFVSNKSQIDPDWFLKLPKSVGICGATSTPPWLMQQIAEEIRRITKDK